MLIDVRTQEVHKHKKNIRRSDLKGLTCFLQMAHQVRVNASGDHQAIVQRVLGEPDSREFHKLGSYWCWEDVNAQRLVDVLYAVATAQV